MDGRASRGMIIVGLFAILGTGCHLFTPKAVLAKRIGQSAPELPRATVTPNGDTPVTYHTRLVDQPAGSSYLNSGLWDETANPLSHAQTTLLALNGLRIGVICRAPPAELERLASSDATVLGAMLRSGVVGGPRVIPINGPVESCQLGIQTAVTGAVQSKRFELVECGLTVTATALPEDKLKLHCEFQIQHGERQPWLRPTSDGSGFARTDARASESFPALAFDVTLGRSDLLVIGASEDPVEKLGQAYFFAHATDRIRQRVLLLQVGTHELPGVGK